jgi:hypothetical protein
VSNATVWVIEDGDYSDYHVVGVFTSLQAAQTVRDAIGEGTIAEWPLDPAVSELNQGLRFFSVRMLRDGTVEQAEPTSLQSYSIGKECWIWRRSIAPAYRGTGVKDCLCHSVFAEDEKHAIKIMNEKRLQMIAMGRWAEGEQC